MKSKVILVLLSLMLVVTILTGCTKKPPVTETPEVPNSPGTDVVSGPTRAKDEATFEDRISKDGTWIIIVENDLTFTKDLTVDGTFKKEGEDTPSRVLALVVYKEGTREIDKKYTLTVPNLVINSESTLIEYGIIKGDVYVQTEGFTTLDVEIDGNLYFATEDLKNAFALDEDSEVSGEIGVREYTK